MSEVKEVGLESCKENTRRKTWVLMTGFIAVSSFAVTPVMWLLYNVLDIYFIEDPLIIVVYAMCVSFVVGSMFLALLWRYRGKNGWIGFVIGFAIAALYWSTFIAINYQKGSAI